MHPPNNHAAANTNNHQAGGLSKIVIAQVFLLLSTIKEDKDRTKWDSQAEQIRKVRAMICESGPRHLKSSRLPACSFQTLPPLL